MPEAWLQRAVDAFWAAAGDLEPFPRNMEAPTSLALPLTLVKVPRLCLRDTRQWLEQRRIVRPLESEDRPLHAYLIAFEGTGIVFLDSADSPEELRFSLAHEVSHFLLDYLKPRSDAVRALGEGVLEVFDGKRAATVDERVNAVLARAPIGVHTHLMGRREGVVPGCGSILGAENRADRMALELLAPRDTVHRSLASMRRPPDRETGTLVAAQLLNREFGLPYSVARMYGNQLVGGWYGRPSIREWLGIP